MDRIKRKLSSWKGKYFSIYGRVTLIKSVLTSIPIYFLSCFRCLAAVVKRIEKIRRDFLWNDTTKKGKFHLVNWNMLCQPVAFGGLGVRSISSVNKALLGKWIEIGG